MNTLSLTNLNTLQKCSRKPFLEVVYHKVKHNTTQHNSNTTATLE